MTPNSTLLKLFVNLNQYEGLTPAMKLKMMENLLVIDAFQSDDDLQVVPMDSAFSVEYATKKLVRLMTHLDEYVSYQVKDLSLPLKFVFIDNVDMLSWAESSKYNSKLRELYNVAHQVSLTFNCTVLISRVKSSKQT